MRDVPFGHGDGGVECAGIGAQGKRRLSHMSGDRLGEVGVAVGHHLAQVAQGEDALRGFGFVHDHHAAHLLLVHGPHRFTQRRGGAAGHRVTHGQLAQASVQRVLIAQRFHRLALHLSIDLIEQAADTAQGEVAKRSRQREQADEGGLVQLEAEGVLGGQVLGSSGPLAEQRGQWKTFTQGDFEGGFSAPPSRVRTLADHAALLDDVEMLDRTIARLDNAFAGRVKTQLALLDQKSQVRLFHLIERRKTLEKLQGAVDVLQYRRLACLGEGIRFAHGSGRLCCCGVEGDVPRPGCPLDVSLKKRF
jgi:hypothetical protein